MRRSKTDQPMPLYPTEDQIAAAVLPEKNMKSWSGIAAALEKDGFPMVDPLFGGRYWPAVKAFLDRRAGLRKDVVPQVPDGEEDWS